MLGCYDIQVIQPVGGEICHHISKRVILSDEIKIAIENEFLCPAALAWRGGTQCQALEHRKPTDPRCGTAEGGEREKERGHADRRRVVVGVVSKIQKSKGWQQL